MTTANAIAQAVVAMSETREEVVRRQIESEYVDYYLEIQASFGGGERYYTVEPKIDDGRIVAQTATGYEVKTLHDMGLASDFHSGMQLVNRLRRHGFNLVGNKPEDLVPINNTHPSSSRSWETFFVFSMKVPLSFLREPHESIDFSQSDGRVFKCTSDGPQEPQTNVLVPAQFYGRESGYAATQDTMSLPCGFYHHE
ncbi:unnamed protein product [Symbiodinium necroappetens]|uniref:Uncharacterized protein n=1 Tax=Symbiodinium necroappetens TaxID=1628268 RepID=A0A812MMM5_9DINO|nr:unnamed protein product [Symbiodinium necroappetens]